ncbi:hypothetical protein [Streptomyces griseus]|uniref:hypothetical protein n=1 Tax=Streptomyces griseus TaxID=1911 RepID=UPI0036EE7BC5
MRVDSSPGVELLLAIGAAHPELLLTGATLQDQGLMASGLLAAGRPVPLLWEQIARSLPDPLRRTVGAVIPGRLKAAAEMPVPGSAAGTPASPHRAPGPHRTGGGAPTGRRQPRPRGRKAGHCLGLHLRRCRTAPHRVASGRVGQMA